MNKKHTATFCAVEKLQGFDAYRLGNDALELTVVPELGAKIISLKNRKTGREWLWHPGAELILFRNRPGDDFALSPLVGVDECIPTIAPCEWQGRPLPDHGEVWPAPWNVDDARAREGILSTSIRMAVSPFHFTRAIELDGSRINLRYRLENLGAREEAYMWAIHPLIRLREGDRLELPASTRARLEKNDAWVDAVDTAIPDGDCSKIFARGIAEGRVAIANIKTGERFEMLWNIAENDSLGIWLTRGGWHGYHHFAIEPTNGSPDPLASAVSENHHGKIAASGVHTWSVCLNLVS